MSDAVKQITEAVAGSSEAEAASVLANLGVQGPRKPKRSAAARTPLPASRECSRIRSQIEWV